MKYIVKDVCKVLEEFAPTHYQESYDNSGLLVGDLAMPLTGILLSVDITEDVIDDAINKGANMIVSHHPIIFGGLKKLTGANYVQRTVIKAIQNNIALYASHTNLDSVKGGVNYAICKKIGLQKVRTLSTKQNDFLKLVTFVPIEYITKVQEALFASGCGHIGNYDNCSFRSAGVGTFRASDNSTPFVGERNKLHSEKEYRIEVVLPYHLKNKAITSLKKAHPYEEVAYDLYPIINTNPQIGMGCIGSLNKEMKTIDFLGHLKNTFRLDVIRHTAICKGMIKNVAVCGGSGSFLLNNAIKSKADIFVSGDFKYHDFFNADNQIIVADIGHYESELCSMEIFNDLISKKLPKFAIYFTNKDTNPIKYFL